MILTAALLAMASCSDKDLTAIDGRLSDSEKALQALSDRITTVEQTLLQINTDIRTLMILKGGKVVNKVEGSETAGWTLTLGDGRVVTIPPKGPEGNAPVIAIDGDGYWTVDYGNGPVFVLDPEGKKVPNYGTGLPGSDAIGPMVGVDKDGFWKISYDEGQTWTLLLDGEGQPVPTEMKVGETLFESAEVVGSSVEIVVKNGETLVLPLVSNFLFSIRGVDSAQTFTPGQTREYALDMEGILQAVVTTPNGWSSSIEESTLKVTAAASTKVSFDSESCVAVYAVSMDGHSVITGFEVNLQQ